MNKIDYLIKKMCAENVKKYAIEDICKVTRGRVISKNELSEKRGEYPVYSSQTLNNGVFGKINTYDYDGEYIQWTTDGANAGSIFYRNGKFSVTNVCGLLKIKDEYLKLIRTDYLAYLLSMKSKEYVNYSTSNPKLMSNVMSKISVIIPPIEVQEEVVKILDKFSELEVELEVELEARKKQYQYWYKRIFKLNEFETYKMTDIFNLKNGFTPSKSNEEFWKNGLIPWFRMEDIRERGGILSDAKQHVTKEATKGNIFPKNSIIISTSATIGVHALITTESLSNQRFTYLILKDEYKNKIDMKYIYYYCFLLDQYCLENLNKGNFASVDMNAFKKFEFKIPSLKEQKRIVNILDKFDKLINNISEGLPGEIKLRRKQYEYYRNKLLNFKEVIA